MGSTATGRPGRLSDGELVLVAAAEGIDPRGVEIEVLRNHRAAVAGEAFLAASRSADADGVRIPWLSHALDRLQQLIEEGRHDDFVVIARRAIARIEAARTRATEQVHDVANQVACQARTRQALPVARRGRQRGASRAHRFSRPRRRTNSSGSSNDGPGEPHDHRRWIRRLLSARGDLR